ncbi:MAG: hypothetical protein HC903_16540 [Methylacidiphilales bacterium]|nr:hypothetical protein [Candidatus Methylacidiphilales bacterium]NJR14934.1 hypothetical protein [Calothrix sp. CSU_2_0]
MYDWDILFSVSPLGHLSKVKVVLVGDGWSVFRDGYEVLQELVASF